jgi:hypothetical protein
MGVHEEIHQQLLRARARQGGLSPTEASDVVAFALRHWDESTLAEAHDLVELMESVPSTTWFNIMYRAEHHDIAHWQLLLEHGDRLYERAADAAAEQDGLTTPPSIEQSP